MIVETALLNLKFSGFHASASKCLASSGFTFTAIPFIESIRTDLI